VPHPELCVFLGDKQVQPTDRTCSCPFLPENWYLQIGVELGWIGFLLYLGLVVILLLKIFRSSQLTAHSLFLAFLGISIAGLFLHSWEDAAIAYALWLLIAAALPVAAKR
jgi:O-antigen ligase